jgi:hypothetical protein
MDMDGIGQRQSSDYLGTNPLFINNLMQELTDDYINDKNSDYLDNCTFSRRINLKLYTLFAMVTDE